TAPRKPAASPGAAKGKALPPRPLPGDMTRDEFLERLIRVDHAGEYGAERIYAGQLAVLGDSDMGPVLEHMAEQELVHKQTFEKMIVERRVRPTALLPLWHVFGYAMGAGTAMMGRRAAMACTVAVEEVIDEHYASQQKRLGPDEAELWEAIERFRLEELEHRDIGLANEAELTPGYKALAGAIKGITRTAIWLSERI
ncbi:MAG: demethoxyubiquinone hydroxylase family protein, partial [Acetobacterales bacterium]